MHDSVRHRNTSTSGMAIGMGNLFNVIMRRNCVCVKFPTGEACRILFSVKFRRHRITMPLKLALFKMRHSLAENCIFILFGYINELIAYAVNSYG